MFGYVSLQEIPVRWLQHLRCPPQSRYRKIPRSVAAIACALSCKPPMPHHHGVQRCEGPGSFDG
jgi:hypothetical protein